MPQDFSRKKLRGRNFARQDLTGANFSRSDIRGVNFTNAILREANFTEAKAGLQDRWSLTRLGILFIMSYTALSLSMSFCSTVINYLIYSGTGGWVGIWWTVLILFFYTALFFTLVNQGFTIRAFRTVLNTAVFLYLLIFLTTCSRSVSSVDFSPVLVTVLGVIVNAVLTASFVVLIGMNLGVITIVSLIEIVALIVMLLSTIANSSVPVQIGTLTLTITILFSAFLVLSSNCIAWLALKGDERFAVIRTFSMISASVGGTTFRGADLTGANFYMTWLRNTDFEEANLNWTYWYLARKIDFIISGETYLKDSKIRNLVSSLAGKDQNFDLKNLTGVNLQGADLANASFIGANLSYANLRKTNLSNAKLVGANLDCADLAGACLTGAYIQDVGITRKTNLERVECKYVYMRLPNESDHDPQRMPPSQQGDFGENDFQIFITSVLDTLDLYHKQEINAGVAITVLKGMTQKYSVTLEMVGLENRGNRQFIIRLKVYGQASYSQLREDYYSQYEQSLPVTDPQKLIPDVEDIAAKSEAKVAKIIEDMKQNPGTQIVTNQGIVITGGVVSMSGEQNVEVQQNFNASVYGVSGNVQGDQNIFLSKEKQTLAEMAKEIQDLLKLLESSNPNATQAEKEQFVTMAISSTRRQRILSALDAGSKEALKEFMDNPYLNVAMAILEGWKNSR
jgi:uncharacterized protein YjbI with pentapeptide repeats